MANSLNEGFDNIATLGGDGWFLINNSAPVGALSWFQGTSTTATPTPGPFNAFDGAANAYIAANFNSTGNTGTISDWLLTPPLDFGNSATVTFYTRKPTISAGQTDYPDRLEVRLSTNGASTNVGAPGNNVGDFTTLLLSINPSLVTNVYPQTWTQFTVSGLPHNGQGRIAFRYFVTGAGALGSNSDYIGIDRVVYNTGAPEYQISGSVSGLAGSGLVLQLNGGNDLPVNADGSFTFPPYITQGGSYDVTVASQPSNLSQTCSVTNGSGAASGTVTNVQVSCVTNAFSVGGHVGGLAGSGLMLQVNGGQDLSIAADGSFAFPTSLTDGSAYAVTIAAQPTNLTQTCAVTNGSGTLAGTNVSDVEVTCITSSYFVGGSVSGLAGSGLVLHLDSGQDVPVSTDGTFMFANSITDGSAYSVSVGTQPTNLNQNCAVTNGSGTLAGANVSDVQVTCATLSYFIGGSVSGLAGSGLVLHLDSGQDVPVAANGSFMFANPVTDGSAYTVSVGTPPGNPNQSCTVVGGSGTLAGNDVTSVQVSCTTLAHTIGGNVAGLSGTGLVLQLNGGDDLPVPADGAFVFSQGIQEGASYAVTILSQPSGGGSFLCFVANGDGTMNAQPVSDIAVICDVIFLSGFELP
ncbi:choice-of-anchor J domain-containing protein [Dokdonella sp.]|uniref:choice-of-anchor J domain-containing protein n=1 Tax=Dokdonella sp. TaxID=2291710 RepID=UPI002F3F6C11